MSASPVLVTGVAGFIGSHLAEALLARGEAVVGLDNFDAQYSREVKERNLADLRQQSGFTLIEGDIRDEALLHQIARRHGTDRVVHLAAKAGVRESLGAPEEYLSVNVMGTLRLLQTLTQTTVRKLVFVSSSSVYGHSAPLPFREGETELRPVSPYGASKVAAEAYCHAWHQLQGVPVMIARLFNPIGPRQRPGTVLETFARAMLAGRAVTVHGDGSASRDYTYVGDTVSGLVAALDAEAAFDVVNLGRGEPVSLSQVVAVLAEALGTEPRVEYGSEQAGDVPHTCADVSKAARVLGWRPQVSFPQAVAEFVRWLRATG